MQAQFSQRKPNGRLKFLDELRITRRPLSTGIIPLSQLTILVT